MSIFFFLVLIIVNSGYNGFTGNFRAKFVMLMNKYEIRKLARNANNE